MQAPLLEGHPQTDAAAFNARDILKEAVSGTVSFGIRGVIVALHYAGNGLIMSSLGHNEAAASSLIATLQGLTIGASSGFMLSTGIQLGSALAEKDLKKQSAVIKTSWAMALFFSLLTSAACLSTEVTFPLVVDREVAIAASTYLKYFAMAAFPDLLIITNAQIIFQKEKKSWIPLATSIAYRMPALGLSYAFGKTLGWGSMGVALGSVISGWLNIIAFQRWFSREAYQAMDLYKLPIPDFSTHCKKFLSSGWKLSMQRITEWGNLAILTQIIGAWSSEDLVAEQASIFMINLCALIAQGGAQAAMLIAKRDVKEMQLALQDVSEAGRDVRLSRADYLRKKNRVTFYGSTLAGVSLSMLVGTGLYLAKGPILDWYSPDHEPESVLKQGSALLLVNFLGLLPDASRIISAGMLRSWDELVLPMLVSLVAMSLIGIPAGAGWGLAEDKDSVPLFIIRAMTICLSAAVNLYRVMGHLRQDDADHGAATVLFNQHVADGSARVAALENGEGAATPAIT